MSSQCFEWNLSPWVGYCMKRSKKMFYTSIKNALLFNWFFPHFSLYDGCLCIRDISKINVIFTKWREWSFCLLLLWNILSLDQITLWWNGSLKICSWCKICSFYMFLSFIKQICYMMGFRRSFYFVSKRSKGEVKILDIFVNYTI